MGSKLIPNTNFRKKVEFFETKESESIGFIYIAIAHKNTFLLQALNFVCFVTKIGVNYVYRIRILI